MQNSNSTNRGNLESGQSIRSNATKSQAPPGSSTGPGQSAQYDWEMDDLDIQLQYARPEPIGFQPPGYFVRRDPRDRDVYHDNYRRRDDYDYRMYRERAPMDYMETSRYDRQAPFNTSRGYSGPASLNSSMRKQEYLDYLQDLRVRDPIVYRKWYDSYLAHPKNPPPPPGYHPSGSSRGGPANYATASYASTIPRGSSSASHYDKRPGSGRSSVTDDYRPQAFLGGNNTLPTNTESLSLPYNDPYNFIPIRDENSYKEETPLERMTPYKFPSSHCLSILSPLGQLFTVKSGSNTVEINSLGSMLSHLVEYKKIEQFPGPLIRGKVHKIKVIQFCQMKIKEARSNDGQLDRDSFILLWEFLILLLRQNGSIVGSDIAELLLKKNDVENRVVNIIDKDRQPDDTEDHEGDHSESAPAISDPFEKQINEAQVLKMFCDYLLYGHTKDALDYAMRNNLWGHALLLASKMGEKDYGNVMKRFVNGMASNHPLVTLYQVMDGKTPSSLRNCCDENFGDWKPHLAMVLSNSGWKPEFETKSIITLGDVLGSRNHIYGSQFCYLMANLEFSAESKLGPLLGLAPDHSNMIEATQMTEIYEFARSLAEPGYLVGTNFMLHKYDYVKLLVDFGFCRDAYSYCEDMGKNICQGKGDPSEILKWSILQIAERLKSFDESEDPTWIKDFKRCLPKITEDEQKQTDAYNDEQQTDSYNDEQQQTDAYKVIQNKVVPKVPIVNNEEEIQRHISKNSEEVPARASELEGQYPSNPTTSQQNGVGNQYYNLYQGNQPNIGNQPTGSLPGNVNPTSQQNVVGGQYYNSYQEQLPTVAVTNHLPGNVNPTSQQSVVGGQHYNSYQEHQPNMTVTNHLPGNVNPTSQQSVVTGQYYNSYQENQPKMGDTGTNHHPGNVNPISQQNVVGSQYYNSYQEHQPNMAVPNPLPGKVPIPMAKLTGKPISALAKPDAIENKEKKPGWLGSLVPSFSFKPKNQMKLPDDKDPPIVWDEATKKWVNKQGDTDVNSAPNGPPPSDSELTKNINNNNYPLTRGYNSDSILPPSTSNANSNSNKYKLQKGRTLRSSYVDVFNPSSGSTITESGPSPKTGLPAFIPPMFIPGPPEAMSDPNQSSFFTSGFQQHVDNQEHNLQQ